MKHTMKKLLCMALAIMLLVSAVPVFAAASETTRDVLITVTIDGNTYKSEKKTVPIGDSVESIAAGLLPGEMGTLYTYNEGYFRNGTSVGPNDTVLNDTNTVTVKLRTLTTDITITKGTQSKSMNLKVTDTVTVGTGLLTSVGLYVGDNEEIAYWSVNGASASVGAQFTAKDVKNVTCVVTEKAPAVGVITAVYSVDGGTGREMKISSNSNTVAELMEKGGYPLAIYELTAAGLGGTGESKGLNDTIVAGQKVYIKMATKTTTPSNPNNPSTPTTSSWINFAVKVDSSSNVVYDNGKNLANGSSATINNLLKNLYNTDWASKYDFDYAWSSNNQTKITDVNATVYAGDTVTVMLKTKSTADATYDYGTNGRTVHFLCAGQVVYSKVVHNDAELAVAKSEAQAKITALGCYKFNGWK